LAVVSAGEVVEVPASQLVAAMKEFKRPYSTASRQDFRLLSLLAQRPLQLGIGLSCRPVAFGGTTVSRWASGHSWAACS